MTHPNPNAKEIQEKIKDLEDKLWDAIHYISSDFCQHCSQVYSDVRKYEQEIQSLKEQLLQYETTN